MLINYSPIDENSLSLELKEGSTEVSTYFEIMLDR